MVSWWIAALILMLMGIILSLLLLRQCRLEQRTQGALSALREGLASLEDPRN